MDAAIVLKLLCDMALWFAAAGFFAPTLPFALPALILAVCGSAGAALAPQKPAVRLLPLLPVLLVFLWIHSWADAFVLVPPCAYVLFAAATGRFGVGYDSFVGVFKPAAAVLALATLSAVVFAPAGTAAKNALPYAVIYVIAGVLLLRLLRHDEAARHSPRAFLLGVAAPLGAVLLAVLLTGAGALGALGDALGFLYRTLVAPILMGLAYAVYGVAWAFGKALRFLFAPSGDGGDSGPMVLPEIPDAGELLPERGESPLVAQILIALGALAALFIAYLLFRKLLGTRVAAASFSANETRTRLDGPSAAKKRAPFYARTPRDAVRRVYRKFLLLVEDAGGRLPPSATSLDAVGAAAAYFDAAPAERLRELYLLARYSAHEIARADVKRAKTLLEAVKKSRKDAAKQPDMGTPLQKNAERL